MITVINSFACEPEQQENLVRASRDAAPEFGALPGIAAATLHRSLDGTRVVNHVQVRSVEDYENLRKVGGLLRSHQQICNRKARCSRLRSCGHAGSGGGPNFLLIARESHTFVREAQVIC